MTLGDLPPQVAGLRVAPDFLLGARAQALWLLFARSTLEIMALLTPERSASSARLSACACLSASSRVAMSMSMFWPGVSAGDESFLI
jgi:hypothetical protein